MTNFSCAQIACAFHELRLRQKFKIIAINSRLDYKVFDTD